MTDDTVAHDHTRESWPLVSVGRAFVFMSEEARRLQSSEGTELTGPSVLSRLEGAIPLPGLDVPGVGLDRLDLRVASVDRDLYHEGRDRIHLCVYDASWAERDDTVTVLHNGRAYYSLPVRFSPCGLATVTLQELPAGRFEVRSAPPRDDVLCSFTVAAYRLAPLSVRVTESCMRGGSLDVVLEATTYGSPVRDELRLTIFDQKQALASGRFDAHEGKVQARLPLLGDGPFTLTAQMTSDPSRTASLPLVGTASQERIPTCFSSLGPRIQGAVLPRDGSHETRGIHFWNEGVAGGPFSLERVDADRVRLKVERAIEAVHLVMVDPRFPTRPVARKADDLDQPHATATRTSRGFRHVRQGSATPLPAVPQVPQRDAEECRATALRELNQGRHRAAVGWLREALLAGKSLDSLIEDPALEALQTHEAWLHLVEERPVHVTRGSLHPGEVVELKVPVPMGLLLVGAFVDGQPWEGWAAVVAPARQPVQITVDDCVRAGEDVEITLQADLEAEEAWVIVRDCRLSRRAQWDNSLAQRLKALADRGHERLATGVVRGNLVGLALADLLGHEDLARFLVMRELVSADIVQQASRLVRTRYSLLGALCKLGAMTPEIMAALGRSMDASLLEIDPDLSRCIPEHLAQRYKVIPLGIRKERVFLGMADPCRFQAIDDIQLITGFIVEPVLLPEHDVCQLINLHFGVTDLAEVQETADDRFQDLGWENSQESDPQTQPADGEQAGSERPQSGTSDAITDDSHSDATFTGLVTLQEGRGTLRVPLGRRRVGYVVEVLAVSAADWSTGSTHFRAERWPSIDLVLPAHALPEDLARGRVHIDSRHERVRVRVERDGELVNPEQSGVALETPDGGDLVVYTQGGDLTFHALPGNYWVVVKEEGGGEERATGRVELPGRLACLVRVPCILRAGESVDMATDPSLRSVRVVMGLQEPILAVAEATSRYEHLCCEQTAAKIVASAVAYLLGDRARRGRAEAAIVAGVQRLESMFVPGEGFRAYPGLDEAAYGHLGVLATRHLLSLALLRQVEALSPTLSQSLERVQEMARDASRSYHVQWPSTRMEEARDAWAAVRFGTSQSWDNALAFARRTGLDVRHALETRTEAVRLRPGGDALIELVDAEEVRPHAWTTAERVDASYAAATLARAGDTADLVLATELGNEVLRGIGPEGRLYSTTDSVACLAMMLEFKDRSVEAKPRLVVDGCEVSLEEAAARIQGVSRVEVLEGEVTLEAWRARVYDWRDLRRGTSTRISITRQAGPGPACPGDLLTLRVAVTDGKRPGDICCLSLPPAVAVLEGGGQVRQMNLDFAGASALEVLLVAVEPTEGRPQHVAVCLRNMYEETQGTFAGLWPVIVAPASGKDHRARELERLWERTKAQDLGRMVIVPAIAQWLEKAARQSTIQRGVRLLLAKGMREGLERMTVEHGEQETVIWCRASNGVIEKVALPLRVHLPTTALLLLMADLSIAHSFQDQRGRFKSLHDNSTWWVYVTQEAESGLLHLDFVEDVAAT